LTPVYALHLKAGKLYRAHLSAYGQGSVKYFPSSGFRWPQAKRTI
jgi:hypothetical protein